MKPIVIAIFCMLAACSTTPLTQHYTLLAPNVEPIVNEDTRFDSIGVGPILLPEYLSNIGIVSIANGNQVKVGLYDIWAGNLKDNITSVVANHLSQLLNHDQVWPFPWDNRHRPEMQLRIVFEQLSGSLGQEVTLQAKWTLLGNAGKKELITRKVRIVKTTNGEDYNSYVMALNSALNQMTQTITAEIVDIETKKQ